MAQLIKKETTWWVCFWFCFFFYFILLFCFQKIVMKCHQKLKINSTKYCKDVITLGEKTAMVFISSHDLAVVRIHEENKSQCPETIKAHIMYEIVIYLVLTEVARLTARETKSPGKSQNMLG